jgi:hypothetical protein
MSNEAEVLEVTPDQVQEWAENPITKEIVKEIVDLRDRLQEYLATGQTAGINPDYTTDRIFGRIEGLVEVFGMFSNVGENAKEKVEYDH